VSIPQSFIIVIIIVMHRLHHHHHHHHQFCNTALYFVISIYAASTILTHTAAFQYSSSWSCLSHSNIRRQQNQQQQHPITTTQQTHYHYSIFRHFNSKILLLSANKNDKNDFRKPKSSPSSLSMNPMDSIPSELDISSSSSLLYQQYIQQPAQTLKQQLESLHLNTKGRKPDLAKRLVEYYTTLSHNTQQQDKEEGENKDKNTTFTSTSSITSIPYFATIPISHAAHTAILQAKIYQPTSIQQKALPILMSTTTQTYSSSSIILHAETGSGKTLCYLLPITERAWKSYTSSSSSSSGISKFKIIPKKGEDEEEEDEDTIEYALILTPNRELAIQVASVAQVLAPPHSVRLIPYPMNVLRESYRQGGKDVGENRRSRLRIIIASAQTIYQSLFGINTAISSSSTSSSFTKKSSPRLLVEDGTTSSQEYLHDSSSSLPPTSKPEAKYFLRRVSHLVLDEVDRLLLGTGSTSTYTTKSKYHKKHEKPAAILTASIVRQTLGKVQVMGVSATVGRPLRREMARVLGISPKEGPWIITSTITKDDEEKKEDNNDDFNIQQVPDGKDIEDEMTHHQRVITIPSTIQHYVFPCDGSTHGSIVTSAAFMIKELLKKGREEGNGSATTSTTTTTHKILLVIAKDIGIQVSYILGALNHFGIQPKPILLSKYLDSLEDMTTNTLIEHHHHISKCTGLGQDFHSQEGYILVTSEDDIRGLHLNDLDIVVLVGRPRGPDEYLHIAGKTMIILLKKKQGEISM